MDRLARIPARDRRDLFAEVAATLGIRPTIIEKDFWVCFVLRMLFVESSFKGSLVFKGGTSLSKVYGLIERFSEDIDLVLDWKLIGFGEGLKDPMRSFGSKTQQDKFNKGINRIAALYISETLCPQLDDLARSAGIGLSAAVDPTDPHVVNIHYPAAFSETYIRPEVRLEIGPLAAWVPSAAYTIDLTRSMPSPTFLRIPIAPSWPLPANGHFGRRPQFSIRRLTGRLSCPNATPGITMISTSSP